MGKKIVYLVLGALFIFGLLFLAWSWFFSGTNNNGGINNGQFGTAGDANQTSGTNLGTSGNGQTPLGQASNGQTSSNGSIPLGGTNGGTGINGNNNGTAGASIGGAGQTTFSNGTPSIAGVTWLNGASGAGVNTTGGGNTNGFTPIGINGINGGTLGGTVPTVGGTVDTSNSSNSQLNILLASGLIGAASCALQAGVLGVSTSGAAAGTAGASAVGTAVATPSFGTSPGPNLVKDTGTQVILAASYGLQTSQAVKGASKDNVTFVSCITNVLAKAALQQITASVVNWINSGFNGQPSFVTNYEQFFTNVADLAAGQFIQGAGLSFLCSPFKLQIKVAIAQSYANRGAQSCSLTAVIKNINGFMNGNFAQGGWPGLLSFTTMPTNNPYGAYAYAQVGLQTAQSNALSNAKNNISPTGFLAVQKATCNNGTTSYSPTVVSGANQQAAMAGGSGTNGNCKTSITTPGTVIEGTLQSTLKSPIDQLGLANSIDQILNALTNQLITKTLQNGLTNLSGTTGLQNTAQTPAEQAAQAQAQGILVNLQAQGTYAQQYGNILQGSIGDIQTTQNQLNTLSNCWIVVASSTSVSASQASTASANATAAQSTIAGLNIKVEGYNDAITSVNAEIAMIQQLQSEALSVSSVANVATLNSDYAAAQASRPFIGAADITTAQQNRTTLQSQLASINASTQAGLQQCRAFGH
jgi:hypothetical protein